MTTTFNEVQINDDKKQYLLFNEAQISVKKAHNIRRKECRKMTAANL